MKKAKVMTNDKKDKKARILTAAALVAFFIWLAAICISYELCYSTLFGILFVGPFAVGGTVAMAKLLYKLISERL